MAHKTKLASVYEEQLERAFYLQGNEEFKRQAGACQPFLGLPLAGIGRDGAVKWLVGHHFEHLRKVKEEAYERDGIGLLRWSDRFGGAKVRGWRPSLAPYDSAADGAAQLPALPIFRVFSPGNGDAAWASKTYPKWEEKARLVPSIAFALLLIRDFELPEALVDDVEFYLVSNEELWISPGVSMLNRKGILASVLPNRDSLSLEVVAEVRPHATKRDWLEVWSAKVKPALGERFGKRSSREGGSKALWARNLHWWKERSKGRSIGAILTQESESGSMGGVNESTASRAIQRVEELMRPKGARTLAALDKLKGREGEAT